MFKPRDIVESVATGRRFSVLEEVLLVPTHDGVRWFECWPLLSNGLRETCTVVKREDFIALVPVDQLVSEALCS